MASDRRSALAGYVRRLRLRAGLTQEELAERAGLTPNTIGALEQGRRRRLFPYTARVLADALGLDAAERAELTALASGRTASAPPADSPPPVAAPPDTPRSTPDAALAVPAGLTRFVGRERELTAAGLLVAQGVRLLTLTGPGGVGKSRLAVEAARTLGRHFPEGVRLVELAPLAAPALVPQAVATVLGVRDAPGRTLADGLVAVLREQTVLLLLDNCEHLLAACAGLVSTLLRGCPQLTVIATSREPLRLQGEQVYPVPPLALPPANWEPDGAEPATAALAEVAAVALFIDRARAVRPEFALTKTNAGAVAAICRRLDGLPLAIELAAARVRVLTPEAIAARLDDRFRLVTGGARDALARHQTLRALIDWSHDLLSAEEQTLLRRLAVFVGGWTLEAAEGAAAGEGIEPDDVLDLLTALVDKSLVVAELRADGARYRLLETVRAYAAEQLGAVGEATLLRTRHRDWFLAWAERLDNKGADETTFGAMVPLVMEEFDNLRAAFEWSLTGERNAALALRIASALWWFWPYEAYLSEGRTWCARALATAGDREPRLRTGALLSAASLAFLAQDYETGMAAGQQALELARAIADPIATITALRGLGLNSLSLGNAPGAKAHLEEALALARAHGARRRLPYVLESLGFACYNLGLGEEGRRHLVEAIEVARAEDIGIVVASGHMYLGFCWLLDGEVAKARESYLVGLAVATELAHQTNMAYQIVALALVAGLERDAVRSTRLMGVWQALSGRLGINAPPPQRVAITRRLEKLRETMGDETFGALLAEGRALPLSDAVAYALATGSRVSL